MARCIHSIMANNRPHFHSYVHSKWKIYEHLIFKRFYLILLHYFNVMQICIFIVLFGMSVNQQYSMLLLWSSLTSYWLEKKNTTKHRSKIRCSWISQGLFLLTEHNVRIDFHKLSTRGIQVRTSFTII